MTNVYVVTAACIVAKMDNDTGEGYFYRDAVLPSAVRESDIERLLEMGLIEEVEIPKTTAAAPTFDVATAKLADLRDYAASKSIELGDAKKVDEIREAITKAEQV